MENKRKMLLTKISNQLPGQEREFLEFMAGTVNSFTNWESKSMEELLNCFIEFEEDTNEEELTEEVVDQVLEIYVEGFVSGEGVF
jgi:hypothetical protein